MGKEVDGKLIINAPYAGRSQLVTTARTTTDTRPKEPRFNDPIENEGSFIPIQATKRPPSEAEISTSPKVIIRPATNLPSSEVRDQPESIDPRTNRPFDPNYNLQGIEIKRPTTEKPILPEYVDNN